ncbi:MAG: shikimate kinase [Brevinema sp.]
MKNIAFIGMMGCGKSTLSQKLSVELSCPLFSIDTEIEHRAQKTISQIFTEEGESSFRAWEKTLAQELSLQENLIIDCGGGFVTQEEAVKFLKKNSILVFIRRPIEDILATIDKKTRPLAGDTKSFIDLYQKRLTLYQTHSDFTINNIKIDDTLQELIKIIGEIK